MRLTYEEAYKYLIKSYGAGRKHEEKEWLGVLEEMGNPHRDIRVIHVAGTNGKGSACAMLGAVLMKAGYSVGMYTSPHLYRFNERFVMNGEAIGDEVMAEYVGRVRTATERYFGNGEECLSFFELLTACGFEYFRDMKPDYVIVEVGIGGRKDVTNVVEEPALSVIMSIGLEHTDILGDTIELITREKAGIVKKNCPAVLYFQDKQVYNIVSKVCAEKGSVLYYAHDLKITVEQESVYGTQFDVSCAYYNYSGIRLGMAGSYQVKNAATALLAVSALRDRGAVIPDKAVYEGLKEARWAGRMELLGSSPPIILEGAHNIDGICMLKNSLERYFQGAEITLVVGILKNKDYEAMVSVLTGIKGVNKVIFTQPAYKVKAVPPDVLQGFAAKDRISYVIPDFMRAVDKALDVTGKDGVVCCCGSLYLVGDVREYLNSLCAER